MDDTLRNVRMYESIRVGSMLNCQSDWLGFIFSL